MWCVAFGVVRNPFSLDRSTAGSSGGPAAGAAASYAMISMGTDTGNSIRGPSGHQGLVGLRSSIGQTSRCVTHYHSFPPTALTHSPAHPQGRQAGLSLQLLPLRPSFLAMPMHIAVGLTNQMPSLPLLHFLHQLHLLHSSPSLHSVH